MGLAGTVKGVNNPKEKGEKQMKKRVKFTKMVGVFSAATLLFTQVFTVGNAIGLETKDLKAQESINQSVLQKITAQGEEAELHIDLDLVYSEENYQNDYAPNTVLVGLRRPSGRRAAAAANMFEGVNVASAESLMTFADENEGITPFSANGADVDTEPSKGAFVEEQTGVYEIVKLNLAGQDVLDAIEILKENPQVVYAEPDYLYTPTITPPDPGMDEQWGMDKIWATEAWQYHTGSSDVVVGVIDTGIDYDHEDLANNIWTNPGEIPGNGIDDDGNGYIDDVYGWDFYHDDNDPDDYENGLTGIYGGHGTHVAGIIGAEVNGIGVVGLNWQVKLAALKYYDEDEQTGRGSSTVRAVQYATKENIPILNNSNGGQGYQASMYLAIAKYNGLFVAAAGNDTANNDETGYYPAGYELSNIISVASTDRNDNLSSFSNYGETTVDIGAPGSSIYSTLPEDSYGYKSGTSMAAPHVTGAAAFLKSYRPGLKSKDLKAIILESGDNVPALAGKTVTGKRLNVLKMLRLADTYEPTEEFTDISAGYPIQDSIDTGDGYKIYRFTPDNSGEYVFRTFSSQDTIGELYTEDGTLVASNDDGYYEDFRNYNPVDFYIAHNASNRRTYYLVVKLSDYNTGAYEVRVDKVDDYGNTFAKAYEIPLAYDVPGRINADNDIDYFKFNVLAAGDYVVSAHSEGSSVYMTVYDENQQPVLQGPPDPDIVRTIHLEPGVYYIELNDYYEDQSNYTLNVSPEDSAYTTLAADNFTTPEPMMMNQYTQGFGFASDWSSNYVQFQHFIPRTVCVKDGKATTLHSVHWGGDMGQNIGMYRQFYTPIQFDQDGEYLVTFKMTVRPQGGETFQNVDFGGQFQVGWRRTGYELHPYTSFNKKKVDIPMDLEEDEEYTFVVKINTKQTENDTLYLKMYSSSETPDYMPENWDYEVSYNRSGQAFYIGTYFKNGSGSQTYPTFDDLYVLKKN